MKNQLKEKILVTGCAGFIGMHLSKALLEQGYEVIGIDNLNSYYDVKLKNDRLIILKQYEFFNFIKVDISNKDNLEDVFGRGHRYEKVELDKSYPQYVLENLKLFKDYLI